MNIVDLLRENPIPSYLLEGRNLVVDVHYDDHGHTTGTAVELRIADKDSDVILWRIAVPAHYVGSILQNQLTMVLREAGAMPLSNQKSNLDDYIDQVKRAKIKIFRDVPPEQRPKGEPPRGRRERAQALPPLRRPPTTAAVPDDVQGITFVPHDIETLNRIINEVTNAEGNIGGQVAPTGEIELQQTRLVANLPRQRRNTRRV